MRQDDALPAGGPESGPRLALYQPDIPHNTGAAIRLAACLGVGLDIIEPLGFVWRPREVRRIALDYAELAQVTRHASWSAFRAARAGRRLVLLTVRGEVAYVDFRFWADDILLLGRESAGVPAAVHQAAAARLSVPMTPPARSLNVVVCAGMVLGEALRQTRWRAREEA